MIPRMWCEVVEFEQAITECGEAGPSRWTFVKLRYDARTLPKLIREGEPIILTLYGADGSETTCLTILEVQPADEPHFFDLKAGRIEMLTPMREE